MPRRLLSLLALLLLVLAAQAVADRGGHDGKRGWEGRGGGDGEDDERDGSDDDREEDSAGSGRDDADDRDEDDERGEDDGGEDGDRKRRGGKTPGRWGQGIPATTAPSVRDAGLQVLPTVLPGRIQFSFLVTAGAPLEGPVLAADLPAAAWTLSGPAAEACDLDGLRLRCAFVGMAAGEVQLVQVSASVDRAPPWELVAHASVAADGGAADAVPGNDAAAGRIGLLLA